MGRLEFRAAVSAPRPVAAWLMVGVASATLWITGELDPWVMPVQLVCYATSYATRNRPPAWCKSGIWLNVGMFAITGVTITKALEGNPATLSLAYFASLSQGLQLLDARPRKSEFLLVALSLFQVILASNLTDSVFFPPLLVVFLVTVTWTLLVHTLRTEAAEAGDVSAAQRAITAGLLRTTLVASGVSLMLALVFFMVLPRMRSSFVRGAMVEGMAVAGFSDQVALGTIGRIRRDDTVVLRVETLEGEAPTAGAGYWRGLTFDSFDGRSWSISTGIGRPARRPVNGVPRFGVVLGTGQVRHALVQRIVREPVEAGVLFSAGPVRRIEGPMQYLELDANGGLYFPARSQERVRYTIWTERQQPSEADLRRDHTALPSLRGRAAEQRAARWLALPALDPHVAGLAQSITAGLESDAARVLALEQHLREHGRYTDEPPDMGVDKGRSPVEDFLLGDLAGHCEYFASGMVVLARSLGIPARLVNGFAGGRVNRIGGFIELTRSDAHAWVEVHYAGAGWVRYDPTPPDLRLRAQSQLSLLEHLGDLGSVIELWWFQRVVDFDSSDQMLALKKAWLLYQDLEQGLTRGKGTPRSDEPGARGEAPWRPADGFQREWLWIFAVGALAFALFVAVRSRRRGAAERIPYHYARALALLARRDLSRNPAATARGFARQVESALPEPAGDCFARLTEDYLSVRFGAGSGRRARSELDRDLATLRAQLRRWRPGHTNAHANRHTESPIRHG